MQYAFNANQVPPSYGNQSFPPGQKYKGVIVATTGKDVTRNGQVTGGYLEIEIACIEGPQKDRRIFDRLNLHHSNPQTVEIANKQLSAYCHVTGVFAFQDTNELCGKPFCFDVDYQIDRDTKQPTAFTEVKALYDINGNPPGKSGSGAMTQPQGQPNGPPAGGVQPQGNGGGWGGQAPQGQGGPAPQDQSQGGQGGAWGAGPGQGGPAPQQGQPQGQGGPQPGGWGQGGQGGAQPGGGAPGWGQGQGGGAPGWGAR